jgi:acyl phosphate:glycerol-3-phosphate acyltransferase
MLMNDPYIFYSIITILSYLIGSVPFGLVLGKVFKVGDIRTIGSGNIGATNALRTGNKTYALAVLLMDGIKGAVAIGLAWLLAGGDYPHAGIVAGLVAVIGHVFPVWLNFKGGKGVATSLGVLLMLHWPTGLSVALMWLVTARLSRYSSLAAILAALQAPIYALAWHGREYALPFLVLTLLVLFTHRENLRRLLKGEEPTIKLKAS